MDEIPQMTVLLPISPPPKKNRWENNHEQAEPREGSLTLV